MSIDPSPKLLQGQPALLKEEEIPKIKSSLDLDVLVVGMNPSLSLRTYKQLYDRLKKRHEESGFLDVLNELSENCEAGFVISLGDEADWNRWVEKTFSDSNSTKKKEALSRLQYYFVEGKKKPSTDEITWPVVRREDNLSNRKTIAYFDTIRRTLAAGLKAMESNTERRELTWYQIDLFHDLETEQKSFLASLKEGKNWNKKAGKAVAEFWEQVDDLLNPKVLLVANSNVSDLIFTNYDRVLNETFNFGSGPGRQGFGKPLAWDDKSFSLRIQADDTKRMPQVVFSRQLSGGASSSMLYYVAKEIGRMLSSED
jgi:hypothetical protein